MCNKRVELSPSNSVAHNPPPSLSKKAMAGNRSFEAKLSSTKRPTQAKEFLTALKTRCTQLNRDADTSKLEEAWENFLEEISKKTPPPPSKEPHIEQTETSDQIGEENEDASTVDWGRALRRAQIENEKNAFKNAFKKVLDEAAKIDPSVAELAYRSLSEMNSELKEVPLPKMVPAESIDSKSKTEKKLEEICQKIKNFYGNNKILINIGLAILGVICGILGFYVFGLTALASAALAIFVSSPATFIKLIHTILENRTTEVVAQTVDTVLPRQQSTAVVYQEYQG